MLKELMAKKQTFGDFTEGDYRTFFIEAQLFLGTIINFSVNTNPSSYMLLEFFLVGISYRHSKR